MNGAMGEISQKVRAEHLARMAYLYVRQSSPRQVEQHQESRRRQYDLVEWATDMGWPRERTLVIDEDQGTSGAIAYARRGFDRMASAVGRGEAGIVIGLEVSRLARNSPDWHHLMYVCRWTDTLMADEHGVYDLSVSADRMVLGLRGQMSELELDNSIHRMVEARWNKARRGEAMTIPPAGYEVDDLGQLVITSDEAVADAVRRVFEKFDEVGSARQVWVWWREQGLQFPVRRIELRSHPVVWVPPTDRAIRSMLQHPIYAGAYVFGRTQGKREIDAEDPRHLRVRRVQLPREQWPVLIRDHHDAYITYEKYIDIQEQIRGNAVMRSSGDSVESGPSREGAALLQGLARCGHCGRRMYVCYGGNRPSSTTSRTLQYRCKGARLTTGGRECQLVGGRRIDHLVSQLFLEAVEPAGVEAAAEAEELVRRESEAVRRSWQLQIEKAEYEADRAARQFDVVEPENRLVARELERRWNARLSEVESIRVQADTALQEQQPLTQAELTRARELGDDLEEIWNAVTTTNRDRKRLLRSVIEEVQLQTGPKKYLVRVVWKGGAVTDREVPRLAPGKGHVTAEDTIELTRRLAQEFDDAQIARILNKQGRRSGFGRPFTRSSVKSMRGRHHIPACPKKRLQDPREGPFTADEAARELGVSMSTIHRWLREGVLAGEQMTPGAPWKIALTEDVRKRLSGGDAPPGWVGLTEAARRLGLSKSHVAHLVNSGKLEAVRVKVGKRSCWRINVESATCGRQGKLFDQMTGDGSEEV